MADGTPERIGRLLGRLVVRGKVAARKAVEPETQEQLRKAYRAAAERAQPTIDAARKTWEERGPDIAEVAAQKAVDGALGAIGLRSPLLRSTLGPLAEQVRQGAGSRARDLASKGTTPESGEESSPPAELGPAEPAPPEEQDPPA